MPFFLFCLAIEVKLIVYKVKFVGISLRDPFYNTTLIQYCQDQKKVLTSKCSLT